MVSVTADGGSARDALEMDRQHGSCSLDVERRSASVFSAHAAHSAAYSMAPRRGVGGRRVERAGLSQMTWQSVDDQGRGRTRGERGGRSAYPRPVGR